MDLRFTADELAFRDELREFFGANLPGDLRERMRLGHAPTKDDTVTWQRILNRRGWAGYSWPKEYGGPGWTPVPLSVRDARRAAHALRERLELVAPPLRPMPATGEAIAIASNVATLAAWLTPRSSQLIISSRSSAR